MAATVSPWANKPGAWALDAEEHEAELLQQPQQTPDISAAPIANDFPSLSTAASTKQKKKKNQTLSLAEFSAKPSPQPVGRTHEDLLMLPTGPRERSAEELDRSRLGGGFKNYGSNSRYGSSSDESSNSRWGSSRVSDDSRRNRDSSREVLPSRADETDNWASAKKSSVGTGNGFDRRGDRDRDRERERGGFFDSQSKADESDSWVSNKTFTPSEGRRFGGGFERRGSFDSLSNGGGGGVDSDNWGKKKSEEISSGGGSGGMRPKLVLQPRTVPVAKEGGVVVVVAPAAAASSPPVAKAKGSNPFGEARPREEVLAEKGKDVKEIEEKFEAVKVIKEEKVEGKRGFGRSWSDNKAERTWRKPDSPPSLPESAEKNENGHAENGHAENGHAENGHTENGHDEEN